MLVAFQNTSSQKGFRPSNEDKRGTGKGVSVQLRIGKTWRPSDS